MRIHYTEEGVCPNVHVSYLAAPCWHCQNPVCIPACPVKAIVKREADGIVVVDADACLGNTACAEKCKKACPYDAPQFGPEPGAKMGKCNFCLERVTAGKLPTCVEACPVRALDAGPLEALEEKYGGTRTAVGFKYAKRVRPAVVFKPKPLAR